jgi:hypothetical protein
VQLTQYYRTYELAWDYDPEDQDRFRRLLLIGLVTVVVLGLVLPFIHLPKIQSTAQEAVPERLARLMEQEKPKPPKADRAAQAAARHAQENGAVSADARDQGPAGRPAR